MALQISGFDLRSRRRVHDRHKDARGDGTAAFWKAQTYMDQQRTTPKPANTPIQVMHLQHTFVRIGGLTTARRSKEDTEWCQFTNAQHNHRKNSSSGGVGQMVDIRPGRMDPSQTPAMGGSYPSYGERTKNKTISLRTLQNANRRKPPHGCTQNRLMERTVSESV